MGWREVGKIQALQGGQAQSHINTARQQVPKYRGECFCLQAFSKAPGRWRYLSRALKGQ